MDFGLGYRPFLPQSHGPACPFPEATVGPINHGYLFQHWLQARALPLAARAVPAVERAGVMSKEVAAAAGACSVHA